MPVFLFSTPNDFFFIVPTENYNNLYLTKEQIPSEVNIESLLQYIVLGFSLLKGSFYRKGDPFLNDDLISFTLLPLYRPAASRICQSMVGQRLSFLTFLANILSLSVVESSRTARRRRWVGFSKQFLHPSPLARHDDRLVVVQSLFSHTFNFRSY